MIIFIYRIANIKNISKKFFPEDFFDLSNKMDNPSEQKNKSKQKDPPKLINPSNTIKIMPNQINVIKEEAFEESLEFQLKKKNLKIIIPDKSNEELEPSTSGSSNLKLSLNTPSPLIDSDKNYIHKNNKNTFIKNKFNINREKDDEKYKVTAHFINEDISNKSSKLNINMKRPSTPNTKCYNYKYNPPLTCDNNKNLDRYKFKYNFETKKNEVIVPKEEKKIYNIQRKNLFKVGYKNKNMIKKQNKNIGNKNPTSTKIGEIFPLQGSTPKNSSLISIKNNIDEKNQNQKQIYKNKSNINNDKMNNIKKSINYINDNNSQKNMKKQRANSMENKLTNKKEYIFSKNELSKIDKEEQNNIKDNIKKEKKNYFLNKNNKSNCFRNLQENKLANVKSKLETEINNLLKIWPNNFDLEKVPEIQNNCDLIFKNIHGIEDFIKNYKSNRK